MSAFTHKKATLDFLREIPLFPRFENVSDFSSYADVPKEWVLFVSDIRGSTKATEEGRYKDVNVVGASVIMAVINALKPQEVFYIFGGDGATFLTPAENVGAVEEALIGSKDLAQKGFGFELRIGKVPVKHLYTAGYEVKVAKYRVSSHLVQTALGGDGISQAEAWVKNPPPGENYEIPAGQSTKPADTTGLECRWNPVDSRRGMITSVLVQSLNLKPERAAADYREVLELVDGMFSKEESSRPVIEAKLSLSVDPAAYSAETKARRGTQPRWTRWIYQAKAYLLTLFAKFFLRTFFRAATEKYKKEVVANSDYRKFDGMLRMVLDLSSSQWKELELLLEKKLLNDDIVYGAHLSKTALVTCLVFNRSDGNHLHFVDGDNGGYSAAAKSLKTKLSQRNERTCSFKPKKAAQ